MTCLSPPFKVSGLGEAAYPELSQDTFRQILASNKPVSPCMFENFDERPRQDILIADRASIRYLVGKTDALLRHNLTVAREVSDASFKARGSAAASIVYLYAWNEWHEGGILEPNAHSGAHDLNIVTDVFQLPRSPSACLDAGQCRLQSDLTTTGR